MTNFGVWQACYLIRGWEGYDRVEWISINDNDTTITIVFVHISKEGQISGESCIYLIDGEGGRNQGVFFRGGNSWPMVKGSKATMFSINPKINFLTHCSLCPHPGLYKACIFLFTRFYIPLTFSPALRQQWVVEVPWVTALLLPLFFCLF